ncbi:MAG: C40 family peptidase [Oscillospiraceae bacterium]|nr:C40 family peptidase [Oscillospiraceae bacterium]
MIKPLKKLAVFTLAAALTVGGLAATALADNGELSYGAATVNASLLNIRSGAGLDSEVLGTIGQNSIIVILNKTNDDWYRINYNGTVGYVKTDFLTDVLTAENFRATGRITKTDVRLRKTFNTDSEVLGTYQPGTTMDVIGINSGWYKVVIDGKTGYIRSDLMEITGSAANVTKSTGDSSSLGTKIADYALQFVGYRYVYGEESPSRGFDCSGLVYYVYGQHGYNLERRASHQYRDNGYSISKSELQAGDLVFFSTNGSSVTHVGIYIGDDQFVHASTSDTGVIISDLTSSYYTRNWFGAKRIV